MNNLTARPALSSVASSRVLARRRPAGQSVGQTRSLRVILVKAGHQISGLVCMRRRI
jgi:hypothetical protein